MKPRPSAWMCDATYMGVMCGVVHEDYCNHCLTQGMALWGHEWAAVAWMALAADGNSHPFNSGQSGIWKLLLSENELDRTVW